MLEQTPTVEKRGVSVIVLRAKGFCLDLNEAHACVDFAHFNKSLDSASNGVDENAPRLSPSLLPKLTDWLSNTTRDDDLHFAVAHMQIFEVIIDVFWRVQLLEGHG
ncbi:hypothetical protein NliqN6_0082 [Naganishia liquefaciens]|uniref:Uncharacterized protein n=1 Tax=Naganishia liquefaciens TaxID=104408 RepID=A0A8H3YBX5_9TREE|nr:hypothetical protein NliqN6_0082 [Naganishia liquefaciens]